MLDRPEYFTHQQILVVMGGLLCPSKTVTRLITVALFLILLEVIPSLAHAQPAPQTILAFMPYATCMRPVEPPCSWVCYFLALIRIGSLPSDEGVGI